MLPFPVRNLNNSDVFTMFIGTVDACFLIFTSILCVEEKRQQVPVFYFVLFVCLFFVSARSVWVYTMWVYTMSNMIVHDRQLYEQICGVVNDKDMDVYKTL